MIVMEHLQTLCAPSISGGDMHTCTAQDNSNFATFLLNLLSTTVLVKILTYKAEFTTTVTPGAEMSNVHEDVYIVPMLWKKITEIATLDTKQTDCSLCDAIHNSPSLMVTCNSDISTFND